MKNKPITISSQIIIDEAKRRGIIVEPLGSSRIIKLSHLGHDEYLCAQYISKTTSIAVKIANNKDKTKELLRLSGISVAEGEAFSKSEERQALAFAKSLGYPVVMKPSGDSCGGKGVFVDIRTDKDFSRSWRKVAQEYGSILVERYFPVGTEYRIVASQEKVLGVTKRVPANIIGDGKHSIKELVDLKNSDPRRGDNSYHDHSKSLVKIIIDEIVMSTLKKNRLSLGSKPKLGEQIFLRDNSNLSTGGDSIDFTDKIHPSVEKIAVAAIRAIPGLAYGGVDFLSKNIAKEQEPDDYIIVEINASPGIFMHHYPFEGKPRNVAGDILDLAFPETKKDSK